MSMVSTKKERIATLEQQVSDLRLEIASLKTMLMMKQDKPPVYFTKLEPDPFTRRFDGGLPVTCGVWQ